MLFSLAPLRLCASYSDLITPSAASHFFLLRQNLCGDFSEFAAVAHLGVAPVGFRPLAPGNAVPGIARLKRRQLELFPDFSAPLHVAAGGQRSRRVGPLARAVDENRRIALQPRTIERVLLLIDGKGARPARLIRGGAPALNDLRVAVRLITKGNRPENRFEVPGVDVFIDSDDDLRPFRGDGEAGVQGGPDRAVGRARAAQALRPDDAEAARPAAVV